MKKANPPAFMFYATDWMASTRLLPHEVKGVYIDLLCWQWDKGGVPGDRPSDLAVILGTNGRSTARLWQLVRPFFDRSPDGLWRNRRLERVRANLASMQSVSAKGGKARAEKAARIGGKFAPAGWLNSHQPDHQPNTSDPDPDPSTGAGRARSVAVPGSDQQAVPTEKLPARRAGADAADDENPTTRTQAGGVVPTALRDCAAPPPAGTDDRRRRVEGAHQGSDVRDRLPDALERGGAPGDGRDRTRAPTAPAPAGNTPAPHERARTGSDDRSGAGAGGAARAVSVAGADAAAVPHDALERVRMLKVRLERGDHDHLARVGARRRAGRAGR